MPIKINSNFKTYDYPTKCLGLKAIFRALLDGKPLTKK